MIFLDFYDLFLKSGQYTEVWFFSKTNYYFGLAHI